MRAVVLILAMLFLIWSQGPAVLDYALTGTHPLAVWAGIASIVGAVGVVVYAKRKHQ
jgi:divalent metal cation (Fe/Co/Zn/Cd) transporter